MCFSATASFSVAGATAIVGLAALRDVTSWRAVPLAAVPMLFAAQQAVEGALWIELGAGGGAERITVLSHIYLIFAEVLWPAWVPIAVLLVEPRLPRRAAAALVAAMGVTMGGLLLDRIIEAPAAARIAGHSIRYAGDDTLVPWMLGVYLTCACGVLFVSSHPMVRLFGVIVAIGFAVSAWAHYATLISVWCFFAAAGSTVVYFHFHRLRAREAAGLPAEIRVRPD
ncbi:MAG: DUF6629 family protein [Oricola sp.]